MLTPRSFLMSILKIFVEIVNRFGRYCDINFSALNMKLSSPPLLSHAPHSLMGKAFYLNDVGRVISNTNLLE